MIKRPSKMPRLTSLFQLRIALQAALAACVSFLVACSGGSQGSSFVSPLGSEVQREQDSATVQLSTSPTSTTPATFAAEYNKKDIAILNASNQRIGTIADYGIPATDKTGLLYTENPNGNTILVYSPPYRSKPTTITFASEHVHSLAVNAITGMFAVMTEVQRDGSGRINFFRRGETAPCAIVAGSPDYPVNAGSAFDAEGTLFFNVSDVTGNGESLIASTSGGCNAKVIKIYQFTTKIDPEVRIAFDKNDNLIAQNWSGLTPLDIYTFAHPKNGVFGSPISETKPREYDGVLPSFLAIGSDGAHFWASFIGTTLGYYDYPAGGKPVVLLRGLDGVNGIATLPPLVP